MKITIQELREMVKQQLEEAASEDYHMEPRAQKDLADDMEFLLKKLLSPKIQEVLYPYMHSRFLESLQEKVHDFKMHTYSRQVGPPMGEHKKPTINEDLDKLRTIAYWMEENGIYDPLQGIEAWVTVAREAGEEIAPEMEQALLDNADQIYSWM